MKTVSEKTAKMMMAAIECSQALDMRYSEGKAVLEHHGFDSANRFEVPASEFVAKLQSEAIDAARTELEA